MKAIQCWDGDGVPPNAVSGLHIPNESIYDVKDRHAGSLLYADLTLRYSFPSSHRGGEKVVGTSHISSRLLQWYKSPDHQVGTVYLCLHSGLVVLHNVTVFDVSAYHYDAYGGSNRLFVLRFTSS